MTIRESIISLIEKMPEAFLPELDELIKNFEAAKTQAESKASLNKKVSKILQKVSDREVPEWDKIE